MMDQASFKTSVVMVSFHTGPVLFRAILSVLNQAAPLELLLVDNGNPAAALMKLYALADEDPRLKIISGHGNIGFGAACNLGARRGSGSHILILNPDSLLPPGALETLTLKASQLPEPYMLGARLLDDDGTDQRGCRRALLTPKTALIEALHLGFLFPDLRLNYNHDPVPNDIVKMPAISGAFMFMTMRAFKVIEGFDEGYFLHVEDLDFCFRFRKAGGEIYFVPQVVVTHIGGTSGATKAFIEKHKARGFVRYFHQNFGTTTPAPILWLLDLAVWLRTGLKILLARA